MDKTEWQKYANYIASEQETIYNFVVDLHRITSNASTKPNLLASALRRAGADLYQIIINASKHEPLGIKRAQ